MSQPTLHTARLRLEPLSDAHLEHEVELDADPEVMRYLGKPRTRAEVEAAHRRRLAAATRVPGLGFWAGFRTAAGGRRRRGRAAATRAAATGRGGVRDHPGAVGSGPPVSRLSRRRRAAHA